MRHDQPREILRADTDHVDDSDVREQSLCGPLVDRCAADADQRRDLADGEELLDRR